MIKLSNTLKLTALINLYSLFKIPLLGFVSPRIIELSKNKSVVRIRLGRRTQNHLKVMYFGALAMGAELSIALKAIEAIQQSKKKIDFIFQDFSAEFLKRADGHVHFVCEQVPEIGKLIADACNNPERKSQTFEGYAFVPKRSLEPVMKYKLTLSVKNRSLNKEG